MSTVCVDSYEKQNYLELLKNKTNYEFDETKGCHNEANRISNLLLLQIEHTCVRVNQLFFCLFHGFLINIDKAWCSSSKVSVINLISTPSQLSKKEISDLVKILRMIREKDPDNIFLKSKNFF